MVNSTLNSMTGFAAQQGQFEGHSWSWDIRSVNARGLDIRLRVPDWIDGLEQKLRAAVGKSIGRGSVSVALRLQREDSQSALQISAEQLAWAIGAVQQVENAAAKLGVSLAATSAADILGQRGVLVTATNTEDSTGLAKELVADFSAVLEGFLAMRAAEGRALAEVLTHQVDEIERLTNQATGTAAARKEQMRVRLNENLARVLANTEGADADRVAQELALIAVKTDVTEEIDRLATHVGAARDLMATKGPVGRKLDFLMQEFNREANTLCAKAQSSELTRIGLDLKATIDQMREQVQNVE